jgi:glycosyltransferase involved in cell wall biosynthesis
MIVRDCHVAPSPHGRAPRLLYAVTASTSTSFFRGRLTYLRERGYDVHLVSSPGSELEQAGLCEGVTTHSLPMHREIALLSDLASLFRAWRLLRLLKPDIVDAGTPKARLLFCIAAALCRVPCRVSTLHGLRLETTTGFLRRLLTWLARIECACVHHVICVSPSLRRRAIELRLAPSEKLVVIGSGSVNGVFAARFESSQTIRQEAENLRFELGIATQVPVVGFVGRLTRDKGIRELVDAYLLLQARFPALVLLLVGAFEKGDPVDRRTRDLLENTPGIVTAGWAKNVVPFYHLMDVLSLPTHREGFGVVSIEAAAAGKPVVVSDVTGVVDAVVDGVTGFSVPVGDAKALADAIGRLLENPELARQMGEEGRRWATAEFQPERIWRGVEELYRKLYEEEVKVKVKGKVEVKAGTESDGGRTIDDQKPRTSDQ